MSSRAQSPTRRPPAVPLVLAAGAAALLFAGCKAFDINVGTKDPIKLDPIKVDLTMRVDVYQYTGKSEEEKQAIKDAQSAVDSQRNRMAEIQTLKDNRFIGENRLGLVEVLNLPAGDYGDYVQKTVEDENADRKLLMNDKSTTSKTALPAVQHEQWLTRSQAAFEGEWVEVDADAPGTYRWEQKKKKLP